jgi:hypothetical protein
MCASAGATSRMLKNAIHKSDAVCLGVISEQVISSTAGRQTSSVL